MCRWATKFPFEIVLSRLGKASWHSSVGRDVVQNKACRV